MAIATEWNSISEIVQEKLTEELAKFDYVILRDRVILFDINKTTGAGGIPVTPELIEMLHHGAGDIYCYF